MEYCAPINGPSRLRKDDVKQILGGQNSFQTDGHDLLD